MQWGDQDGDDDDEKSLQAAVPKLWCSAPDKNGIKTITEYRTEDDGKKVKIIRKVKEIRVKTRVNKHVLERRKWTKFGDATGVPPGIEANVTYHTHENINLQLKPRKREDDHDADVDPLQKIKGDSIVVCRHCGETGHWTLKCPKRGGIVPETRSRPNDSGGGSSSSARTDDAGGANKYVPVHMRAGAAAASSQARKEDDANTIRVTNISEDTTEDDLRDLFRRFGHTTRIYLAKDRQTHVSRGFAFISYGDREGAQKAVDKLNGYGYDNLILHVEFAKPRDEGGAAAAKPSPGSQGAGKAGWSMQGTR